MERNDYIYVLREILFDKLLYYYIYICVNLQERIVPPDPITPAEKRSTLQRLNQVIQHRLVTGNLLPQMRNLKVNYI